MLLEFKVHLDNGVRLDAASFTYPLVGGGGGLRALAWLSPTTLLKPWDLSPRGSCSLAARIV